MPQKLPFHVTLLVLFCLAALAMPAFAATGTYFFHGTPQDQVNKQGARQLSVIAAIAS